MWKGLIAIVMATALAVTPGFVTAQMAPGRGTGPTMSGPMGSGAMMQMQRMMQQMQGMTQQMGGMMAMMREMMGGMGAGEIMGAPRGKTPEKK